MVFIPAGPRFSVDADRAFAAFHVRRTCPANTPIQGMFRQSVQVPVLIGYLLLKNRKKRFFSGVFYKVLCFFADIIGKSENQRCLRRHSTLIFLGSFAWTQDKNAKITED
jgi:hypothetical protein